MTVRFKPNQAIMRRVRSHRGDRAQAGSARPCPPAEKPSPARDAHAKDGGPLQDHALYSCACGYVFEADVSTTVHCPHCSTAQAW